MTSTTTLQYVRTPLGRAAAFSPDAKLSAALKNMLKAVDGKTGVSALIIQFPDHDAADLLGQLEQAGLIKLREERAAGFQPSGFMSDLADLPNAVGVNEASSSNTVAATPSGGLDALQPAHAAPQVQVVESLARIVDVMETFVLTHIPQQAFTVLAKLESFQTLHDLEAELPAYTLLAKESGAAGMVHLAELTERLREAAAA